MTTLHFRLFLAVAIALLGVQAHATPIGTDFTYQGVLADGGAPVNGPYDFRFLLYSSDIGGSQVGSTATVDDLTVTDGRLSTKLDFGPVFDGNDLWLEIHVREGSSTGTYSVLAPRQQLTSGPYAQHALSAQTAASADLATFATSAGDATQLGGQSPSYYLAWSNLTGVPPGLGDGDDDTLAGLSCGIGEIAKWNGSAWSCADDEGAGTSTVVVGPVGSAVENGAALLAAIGSLPAATVDAQILVEVEPGTYDLGAETLVLGDFVSIVGAGRGLTVVTSANEGIATIDMVNDSELRSLTVVNTSAASPGNSTGVRSSLRGRIVDATVISEGNAGVNRSFYNIGNNAVAEDSVFEVLDGTGGEGTAIRNVGHNFSLRNVEATVSGGSGYLYGIYSNGGVDFHLENVTISATAGTSSVFGIYATDFADGVFRHVEIEAESSVSLATGIYSSGHLVRISDARISAAGSGAYAIRLRDVDNPSFVEHSTLSSSGTALYYESGSGHFTVRHSQLTGVYGSLVQTDAPANIHHSILEATVGTGFACTGSLPVTISGSQIIGGTSGASISCAAVWDGALTFYPTSCP